MAKTHTEYRKVDIIDLIRDRKLFPLLDVPPMRVIVNIEVTTSALLTKPKPATKAHLDRLEKAARDKLNEYETTITHECEKFSKKIDALAREGKTKEAEAVTSEVNAMVKNALRSAEGAASKAVEESRKKAAQGDKLLTEARVKTTVKVTFSGISIAAHTLSNVAHVAGIVASHGTHVMGYVSVVTSCISMTKTMVNLGLELKQQLKDEAQLRTDLAKGITAYVKFRSTAVMQVAQKNGLALSNDIPGFPQAIPYVANALVQSGKDMAKGKDKTQIAKEIWDYTVKIIRKEWDDVEKARVYYRNHTVKMRHKVDSISQSADKIAAEMKKATTLKEGVKIGAQCMAVRGKVRRLAVGLEQAEGFLANIESTLKDFGLEVDDRTIVDKVMALNKTTIAEEGIDLISNIDTLFSFLEAVKEVAAVA